MSANKLILLGAAFILASLIWSTPAAAVGECDPNAANWVGGDCDGDLVLNEADTCPFHDDALVADFADCDGDGVANENDTQCPTTVVGADLVVGACTISGLDTIMPTGCSLTELLTEQFAECEANAKNHGKYVSCVSHATNALKKQKFITGRQKGEIQRCAARSDIGKKSHP